MSTRVAVLGAGIQGSCVALALAARGWRVDLFDRAAEPVTQASRWNEGKIHLGFVYAKDSSGRTVDRLLRGALSFDGALQRLTERSRPAELLSAPFSYAVHRTSQLSVEAISAHFTNVAQRYRTIRAATASSYFDHESDFAWERLSSRDMSALYDDSSVGAAFRTIELSVDPAIVAESLRQAIAEHDRIQFHGQHHVAGVDADPSGAIRITVDGEGVLGPYDHAVNALWQERLRIDAGVGLHPHRPWLHRYKMAVHVQGAMGPSLPSTTILLGEYGDIVDFGGGRCYLSWYPACKLGEWHDLQPPDLDATITASTRRGILDATLAALATVVPTVGNLDLSQAAIDVRGGYIFAWGKSGIGDPDSELHSRDDIGIHSYGRYHSIDTGKYCMAPYFAEQLAERLCGRAKATSLRAARS